MNSLKLSDSNLKANLICFMEGNGLIYFASTFRYEYNHATGTGRYLIRLIQKKGSQLSKVDFLHNYLIADGYNNKPASAADM